MMRNPSLKFQVSEWSQPRMYRRSVNTLFIQCDDLTQVASHPIGVCGVVGGLKCRGGQADEYLAADPMLAHS
jgi:hypothetical protein